MRDVDNRGTASTFEDFDAATQRKCRTSACKMRIPLTGGGPICAWNSNGFQG